MPDLVFEKNVYQVDDFDSVLNTLLKNGHAIPNFCRSGICHSCMMKAEEGTPLPFSQIGLADELVAENYFLTCQCAVYAPMEIRRPDKDKRTRFVAMVREKVALPGGVTKILLSPEHDFAYEAGQYTTLINVDGLSNDYSIASVHDHDTLMEFYIPNDYDDPLAQYIGSELEEGDGLEIMTALGDDYYSDKISHNPIVVLASNMGISSAYSFIKKALLEEHKECIELVVGLDNPKEFYLSDCFNSLAQTYNNFSFRMSSDEKFTTDIQSYRNNDEMTVVVFSGKQGSD